MNEITERYETLPALLTARLDGDAERIYTFVDASGEESHLTTHALHHRAMHVAGAIVSAGALRGDRVLLLLPPGLDFIVALIAAMYVGAVPVTAPFPSRPLARIAPRLAAILTDCRPVVVLALHRAWRGIASDLLAAVPGLEGLPRVELDVLTETSPCEPVSLPGTAPAFLQYTSGSTAAPRGVIVTHANVLSNCRQMRQPADSRIVSWLPHFHDFGLVYAILQPLYSRIESVLMSPGTFLQRPVRWLEAIARHRGTHAPAPNFAFELCLRAIPPHERERLDLRCWQAAIVAAEPVRKDTIERFLAGFAVSGVRRELFMPAYGLAEATLMVTRTGDASPPKVHRMPAVDGESEGSPGAREIVSCGRPAADARVVIVDPDTGRARRDGEVGEIWVSGPNVATGYFGRPDESRAVFAVRLADGTGPYLRTGDLGFVQEGELYVVGRIKELVIVDGVNHHPHDLEITVERSHPDLLPGAAIAFGVERDDMERLVVIAEIARAARRTAAPDAIASAIRMRVLEEHGLAIADLVLVEPNTLPKTTSGKRQRLRCREAYVRGELHVVRPAPTASVHALAEREEALCELVSALVRRTSSHRVGPDDVLGTVGLDSVMFVELASELSERHGVTLSPAELFGMRIRDIVRPAPAGSQHGSVRAPERTPGAGPTPPFVRPSAAPRGLGGAARRTDTVEFSLFCFGDLASEGVRPYELLADASSLADRLGFAAIWLPERHFHPFGGISPNPSVLASALTRTTQRIRLRAGSVILPLHEPIRVAEEWALVDNLSSGRVDAAFGWGWNPDDFVLAPGKYSDRRAITLAGIDAVAALWRGEGMQARNGEGQDVRVQLYPRPLQPELPIWLTCTRDAQSFIEAGARGWNVLTALLFQTPGELETKIGLYRAARRRHGHDPEAGVVTVMLHTFVGPDRDTVRAHVRGPFTRYLRSSASLWRRREALLDALAPEQHDVTLEAAFERYFETATLFGAPDECVARVERLRGAGVGEIACLFDFGVDARAVLDGLHRLDEVRRAFTAPRGTRCIT